MDYFSWFLTLYLRGVGEQGSFSTTRRWPVAQTDQELQTLPSSNAPRMHEEATKTRVMLGSTKTLKLRQNLEKLYRNPDFLRHCLFNCLKEPQTLRVNQIKGI